MNVVILSWIISQIRRKAVSEPGSWHYSRAEQIPILTEYKYLLVLSAFLIINRTELQEETVKPWHSCLENDVLNTAHSRSSWLQLENSCYIFAAEGDFVILFFDFHVIKGENYVFLTKEESQKAGLLQQLSCFSRRCLCFPLKSVSCQLHQWMCHHCNTLH